jgi:hypothetical protein
MNSAISRFPSCGEAAARKNAKYQMCTLNIKLLLKKHMQLSDIETDFVSNAALHAIRRRRPSLKGEKRSRVGEMVNIWTAHMCIYGCVIGFHDTKALQTISAVQSQICQVHRR